MAAFALTAAGCLLIAHAGYAKVSLGGEEGSLEVRPRAPALLESTPTAEAGTAGAALVRGGAALVRGGPALSGRRRGAAGGLAPGRRGGPPTDAARRDAQAAGSAPGTVIECLLGLPLCLVGVVRIAGDLKPIRVSASEKYVHPAPAPPRDRGTARRRT